MSRIGRVFALVLLGVGFVFAATAEPLVSRMRPDTILYVGWRGEADMRGGGAGGGAAPWSHTHAAQILDESGISRVVSEWLPKLADRLEKQENNPQGAMAVRLASQLVTAAYRHPSAVWMCGVNFNTPAGPLPRFAIAIQAGDDAAKIKESIEPLRQQFGGIPINMRFVEEKGGLLIFSIGFGADEALLAEPGKSLMEAPEFASAAGQLNGSPLEYVATFYLNTEKLWAAVDSLSKIRNFVEPWSAIKKAVGTSSIRRVLICARISGQDWQTDGFIDSPKDLRNGALGNFIHPPTPALNEADLKLVPASATMVSLTSVDLAAIFNGFRELVHMADPRGGEEFDAGLDELNSKLKCDLLTDILQPLGSRWTIYNSPETSGPVIIGSPEDPNAAAGALDKLIGRIADMIAEESKGEARNAMRRMKVGDVEIRTVPALILQPSWCVKEGHLLMATSPQGLIAAMELMGKSSIIDAPGFVAARKRINAPAGATISYLDLPRTAPSGYGLVVILSNMAATADWVGGGKHMGGNPMVPLETPQMLVPPYTHIAPHLSPAISASWTDDAGAHFRSVTPFPGAELLGAEIFSPITIAPLAASVALPAMAKNKARAEQIGGASNLKQIGMSMMMFANDHNGNYPKTFGELMKSQQMGPDLFVHPQSGSSIPDEIRGGTLEQMIDWVDKNSSYELLAGGIKNGMELPPDLVTVCEKNGPQTKNGMNLLFADGHVEFVQGRRAQEVVARSKERVARLIAEGK